MTRLSSLAGDTGETVSIAFDMMLVVRRQFSDYPDFKRWLKNTLFLCDPTIEARCPRRYRLRLEDVCDGMEQTYVACCGDST